MKVLPSCKGGEDRVPIYFFPSLWAGGILQILQSDWFGVRAVFYDLACSPARNSCIMNFAMVSLTRKHYYILCVDVSVIKLWIKMIPVKWYDIISLSEYDIISMSEMISYHFTGLNCPIKEIVIIRLDPSGCTLYSNLMFFAGLFRSVLEETVPSSAVPSSFYGQGRYSLGDSFLQYGVFIYILGLLLPSFTSVKVYMTRRFLYRSLLVPYM